MLPGLKSRSRNEKRPGVPPLAARRDAVDGLEPRTFPAFPSINLQGNTRYTSPAGDQSRALEARTSGPGW